jgi:hypothetical protein
MHTVIHDRNRYSMLTQIFSFLLSLFLSLLYTHRLNAQLADAKLLAHLLQHLRSMNALRVCVCVCVRFRIYTCTCVLYG